MYIIGFYSNDRLLMENFNILTLNITVLAYTILKWPIKFSIGKRSIFTVPIYLPCCSSQITESLLYRGFGQGGSNGVLFVLI
jgi:hypothetical protein